MPTFDTPEPISVTVELGVGNVRIVAGDRTDTVVEVRPTDATKKSDGAAARQTRVEYASGNLLIKAPKGWKQYSVRGGDESVDVQIDLPAGSHVRADAGVAAFHSTGRLGECRVKTGVGEIRVAEAGDLLELKAGGGDITVGRAVGPADVTTGIGAVRIGSIDGIAVVKNSNGDTWIGQVTGNLQVKGANGRITVDKAEASVIAKTANGDIRIGEVAHGAIRADTAYGKIELGIRDGVAAWLDLTTGLGNVHNELGAVQGPPHGENAVEVRARTALGDITIRHASTTADR